MPISKTPEEGRHQDFICVRCGHSWNSKPGIWRPLACPNCKSVLWDWRKKSTEQPERNLIRREKPGNEHTGMTKANKTPIVISILLLLLAVVPDWPYGYYILLRFVVCGTSFYLLSVSYQNKKIGWSYTCGGIGILFNPIIRFHFPREFWSLVDLIVVLVFAVYIYKQSSRKENIKRLAFKIGIISFLILFPIVILLIGYFLKAHTNVEPHFLGIGLVLWGKVLYDVWKGRF